MATLQNSTTGTAFVSGTTDASNNIQTNSVATTENSSSLQAITGGDRADTRRLNIFGANGSFRGSLISSASSAATDDAAAGANTVRNRFLIQSQFGSYSFNKSTYGFLLNGFSPGYMILPARSVGSEWWVHIIQWGSASVALNSATTLNYPLAYSTGVTPIILTAIMAPTGTSGADNIVTIDSVSATSVTLRNTGASGAVFNPCTLYYRAIGYRRIA